MGIWNWIVTNIVALFVGLVIGWNARMIF